MADWPKDTLDLSPSGPFSTVSEVCPVADLFTAAALAVVGTGALTASLAMFIPVIVRNQITVYQLGWSNGATVSGNVDVGIYDRNQNRLVSAGSTAQAGTSALQIVDVADTVLAPGLYYLAMAMDNGTGLVARGSFTNAQWPRACGVTNQASAFALPSTAAWGAPTSALVPYIFAAVESSVI